MKKQTLPTWIVILILFVAMTTLAACDAEIKSDNIPEESDDDPWDDYDGGGFGGPAPGVDDDDDDSAPDDDDDDDDTVDDDDTTDDDDDVYEPPDGLQVVFYDIGQGDAALVRFPQGKTMLIDGGPNQAGDHVILPHFEELHLDYLDYMVVTHPDADHCGGLDDVVEEIEVGVLWESGETHTTQTWNEFNDAVDDAGIQRRIVHRGDVETIDGCIIKVLNADQGWSERNDNSIVLSIDCEDAVSLFTGDLTECSQADLIDVYGGELAADLCKVPHHGSANRDERFAGYVSPLFAVISVGADNPYGHPTQATIQDWEDAGAEIYRTDQDGTITVGIKDGWLEVTH